MKYTKEEQLNEIMNRGKMLRQRKDRNTVKGLSATAGMLFVTLVLCIGTLGRAGVLESRTDYGSFLLSAETGGYVLVAILAFVSGIVVAALIHKHRNKGSNN